jgi:hypothetical protein
MVFCKLCVVNAVLQAGFQRLRILAGIVSFVFAMAQNTQFNAGPRLNAPPIGDPSREAVASLRGYAYQLYTSALAWFELRSGEELYLEVAEDYAVAAQNALKAVQVKDTGPTTLTINSEGIQEALAAFVDLVERNPQTNVFVHYLSTSPIGQERAVVDRAAGKPTLDYWRSAAAAADVAPLRKVLLAAGLSEKVERFINARDDQALRNEFLKRIQWDCGQPNLRTVQEILVERLDRYCSEELELYADDGEYLVGTVLMHVLNTIVHEKPRRLDSFGLRKLLENSTTVRVPRNAANAILRQAASGFAGSQNESTAAPAVLAMEADLPLPAFLTHRRSLLDEVIARLRTHGAAIVTGSSGRGKTIIARLASRELSNDIRIVDLRNASASETITQLRQASRELPGTRPRAVLLDDLNEMDDPGVSDALARMLSIIQRSDAVCVITAYNQPSGRTLTQAGLDPGACLTVPDLSTEEVREMAVAGGGEPKWAQTLYQAGAFGHPQLVNALISGLRARGWPEDELKRLRLFERSDDVEAERVSARRQLVAALPDDAKALLYRVSLTIGRFDRPIVLDSCRATAVDPRTWRATRPLSRTMDRALRAAAVSRVSAGRQRWRGNAGSVQPAQREPRHRRSLYRRFRIRYRQGRCGVSSRLAREIALGASETRYRYYHRKAIRQEGSCRLDNRNSPPPDGPPHFRRGCSALGLTSHCAIGSTGSRTGPQSRWGDLANLATGSRGSGIHPSRTGNVRAWQSPHRYLTRRAAA